MATEKLSTAEILALARQQGALGGEGGSSPEAAASEPAAEAPAAETPPPAEKPTPKAPAAKPTSTADILAAARAQGSTGGAGAEESEPAPAAKKPAAAPKSTADILAAARAQGGTAGGAAPKAAAGGGAPKSTADILAAARAQKGGGAAAKPAAPKAAKPAATPKAKVAAAAAPGENPSVQEMVRAMHEGGATATAAAPMPTARPRLPGKPPLPPKKDMSRRAALGVGLAGIFAIIMTPFAIGWILMGMLGGLWTLLGARFMMPNMVVELPSKFKVGPPSDFPEGAVSTKFKASRGVWIVNSNAYNGEQLVYALISVCTHLGCTPNWLEGEQKFKCPCHGSGFYISGINFEGPAPRPLERAGIRLAEDGALEVDKSVKFQEELGQWQDPKSFYQA